MADRFLFEDSSGIELLEDGFALLNESSPDASTGSDGFLLEDSSGVLLMEDGFSLLTEVPSGSDPDTAPYRRSYVTDNRGDYVTDNRGDYLFDTRRTYRSR